MTPRTATGSPRRWTGRCAWSSSSVSRCRKPAENVSATRCRVEIDAAGQRQARPGCRRRSRLGVDRRRRASAELVACEGRDDRVDRRCDRGRNDGRRRSTSPTSPFPRRMTPWFALANCRGSTPTPSVSNTRRVEPRRVCAGCGRGRCLDYALTAPRVVGVGRNDRARTPRRRTPERQRSA